MTRRQLDRLRRRLNRHQDEWAARELLNVAVELRKQGSKWDEEDVHARHADSLVAVARLLLMGRRRSAAAAVEDLDQATMAHVPALVKATFGWGRPKSLK